MGKVTPFLMFSDPLDAALEFYATFPGSRVTRTSRAGKDGPIQSAELVIGGQSFMAFAGGPHFAFSEGFSLFVDCRDQAEVDDYWTKILAAGGKESMCGWITDPFGLSWQIVPRRFTELVADGNPAKVKAVIDAMLTMRKLDVAALEQAHASA
jgi:predicted 3-demethylubiquinone-9 3-methyltransferase (glyoxalase superfamily)